LLNWKPLAALLLLTILQAPKALHDLRTHFRCPG
jgi:hypothetical protein